MDPWSAIQCGSAVLAFVDFGLKLISKGNELYRSADGVLSDHAEQDAIATRLARLAENLFASVNTPSTIKTSSLAEKALKTLTLECHAAAIGFVTAIDDLRVTGSNRKWKSFRQALKSVWNKDKLEEQREKLLSLRQEIVVHLLVIVHESQTELGATISAKVEETSSAIQDALRTHCSALGARLDGLSLELSALANRASVWQSTNLFGRRANDLDEIHRIVSRWGAENSKSIDAIVQYANNELDKQKDHKLRLNLLKSLSFAQIRDRDGNVGPKARATLEWLFKPPSNLGSEWADVPMWLQSSHGIYWVSGKAGSGKSTLMKWLSVDPRALALLNSWAAPKALCTVNYFFWGSGVPLQRSFEGFLRSMLHDLLLQHPKSAGQVSQVRRRSADLELSYFPPWAVSELSVAILTLIKVILGSSRICVFVDGLDECIDLDSERDQTLEFLRQLSLDPGIKMCLSSRPLHDIEMVLNECPRLRLDLLTRHDIQQYVSDEFQAKPEFTSLLQQQPKRCEQLVSRLTDRAEGVFLWVTLVVRSLLRGLRNDDTVDDLFLRLNDIPDELGDLLRKMLASADRIYRPKALKLIKLVLDSPFPPSLMTCSFLSDYSPGFAVKLPPQIASPSDITHRLRLARTHIKVQCLGFLEVRHDGKPQAGDFSAETVGFLHMTAREYLERHPSMLCELEEVASFDVMDFVLQSLLAQIKMTRASDLQLVFDLLSTIASMQNIPSQTLELLSHLDNYLSMPELTTVRETGTLYGLDNPHPLLALAIKYNLYDYVSYVVSRHPRVLKLERTRPLLDFALRPRHVGNSSTSIQQQQVIFFDAELDRPNMKLVKLLLENGADPNGIFISGPAKQENSTVPPSRTIPSGQLLADYESLIVKIFLASSLHLWRGHAKPMSLLWLCSLLMLAHVMTPASDKVSRTVWEEYKQTLNSCAGQIQQMDHAARQPWIRLTELLVQYGAPQYISGFQVHLLEKGTWPSQPVLLAFGEAEYKRLAVMSKRMCLTGQALLINLRHTTIQGFLMDHETSKSPEILRFLLLQYLLAGCQLVSRFGSLVSGSLWAVFRDILSGADVATVVQLADHELRELQSLAMLVIFLMVTFDSELRHPLTLTFVPVVVVCLVEILLYWERCLVSIGSQCSKRETINIFNHSISVATIGFVWLGPDLLDVLVWFYEHILTPLKRWYREFVRIRGKIS